MGGIQFDCGCNGGNGGNGGNSEESWKADIGRAEQATRVGKGYASLLSHWHAIQQ
jgi:hypothetical protein